MPDNFVSLFGFLSSLSDYKGLMNFRKKHKLFCLASKFPNKTSAGVNLSLITPKFSKTLVSEANHSEMGSVGTSDDKKLMRSSFFLFYWLATSQY